MTYANGTVFTGGYKDNKFQGTGIYKFFNGDGITLRIFILQRLYFYVFNDCRYVFLDVLFYSILVYEGEFSEGNYSGQGKIVFANGKKCIRLK